MSKQVRNKQGKAILRIRKGKAFDTYLLDVHYNKVRKQINLNLKIKPILEIPNGIPIDEKSRLRTINNQILHDNEQNHLRAKAIEHEANLEIISGTYKFPTEKNQDKLVFLFKAFIETKNTENTKETYSTILKHLLKYIKSDKIEEIPISKINGEYLENFFDDLKSKLSANSVLHTYTILKAFFNFLVDTNRIEANPFAKLPKHIKPKPTEVEKSYLTIEELKQMVQFKETVKEKYWRAFLFSCFTGLRFSDVQNLKWSDIRDGSLHIRQQKSQNLNIIPLSKQAVEILNGIERNSENVFEDYDNGSIAIVLKRWTASAGINKHITFHSGRHSFAVNFLSLGGNLWTLQRLMGHRDIEHTLIYAKIIDSDKAKEIANFEKLDINF